MQTGHIFATLSSHNSPQDTADQRRWNEAVAELRALEAKYTDINLLLEIDEVPVIDWTENPAITRAKEAGADAAPHVLWSLSGGDRDAYLQAMTIAGHLIPKERP